MDGMKKGETKDFGGKSSSDLWTQLRGDSNPKEKSAVPLTLESSTPARDQSSRIRVSAAAMVNKVWSLTIDMGYRTYNTHTSQRMTLQRWTCSLDGFVHSVIYSLITMSSNAPATLNLLQCLCIRVSLGI